MIWVEGTVYLYRHPVDMRKSINGLSVLVVEEMNNNPGNGCLYVFLNKRHNKLKILLWHHNGFCLFYKRLEREKFHIGNSVQKVETIEKRQLLWLLEGLAYQEMKGHGNYFYDIHV